MCLDSIHGPSTKATQYWRIKASGVPYHRSGRSVGGLGRPAEDTRLNIMVKHAHNATRAHAQGVSPDVSEGGAGLWGVGSGERGAESGIGVSAEALGCATR